MLDLYKLQIFQTVATAGGISRAAERLYLTQPAVSQHIQDLEASLGTELFIRGRRGVRLTPAGETLLDYTRCILRMVADAESAVTNVKELANAQLHLGATPGPGAYLLPEWMQSFHNRFPNLRISVSTDDPQHIVEALSAGKIDLGFVESERLPSEVVDSLILREVESLIVVGPGHPWWERASLSLRDLQGQPFLAPAHGSQTRMWLDNNLAQQDVSVAVIAEFDSMEGIKQSVGAGMGVSILPACVIQREASAGLLRGVPIEDALIQRTLKLVWARALPFKPITRAFLTHLSDIFPQLVKLVPPGSELDLKIIRPLPVSGPPDTPCTSD
ncbi:MAG: LysR family transcriptional regulator [Anaerolineae bacterium]